MKFPLPPNISRPPAAMQHLCRTSAAMQHPCRHAPPQPHLCRHATPMPPRNTSAPMQHLDCHATPPPPCNNRNATPPPSCNTSAPMQHVRRHATPPPLCNTCTAPPVHLQALHLSRIPICPESVGEFLLPICPESVGVLEAFLWSHRTPPTIGSLTLCHRQSHSMPSVSLHAISLTACHAVRRRGPAHMPALSAVCAAPSAERR